MPKTSPAQSRTGSQAVERAISVLYAFSSENPALTVSQLAERVGLPVSTTHRIASALVRGRLLTRDSSDLYSIGSGLTDLAGSVIRPIELDNVAPHLHLLSSRIAITASLSTRADDAAVTVYSARPPVRFCDHQLPTSGQQLHLSAMGRVLLAFGNEPAAVRLTPGSVDLAAVRRRGYAVMQAGEYREITAIAVPVFDSAGRVQASLGVQAMSVRLDLGLIARVIPELRSTAVALGVTL
ncbi:IclR family transcriptional regulator [Rhodococcoides yunnanense]|uniref:IclR family transcriptional regulator n=1 Tax=Rhodococcoides yunnanense TaxID=278209 RepID=UPI00093401D3|nr:helix-turn-helix domain-containing protein [Rhodococcus yunnanensis]